MTQQSRAPDASNAIGVSQFEDLIYGIVKKNENRTRHAS